MATRSISLAAAGVLAILGAAGSASAQVLPYGPMLYRVTATRSDGVTGFVEFSSLDGNYNSDPANPSGNDGYWNGYDHYDWTMSIATAIHGPGGELLGRINSAHIEVDSDPFVLANFNVTAGSLNTTFNVSSSNLVVAPSSYTGQASAQVTLTDNDGDGALLAVSTNPAGMYRAMYNGPTVFANLLSAPVVAASFSSNVANSNIGPAPIVGVINDISAQFDFTLSANDTATGTSNFTIVPAPGSIALLGLSGLAAIRRRRSC